MKQSTGSPPTIRPGQRLKVGDIARTNVFVPQEIKGSQDIIVKSVGNRAFITMKKGKRGGRGGGGTGVIYLGSASSFPAIPSSDAAYQFYHTTDTQLWTAHGGDSVWTPLQKATSLSGAP